MEFEERFSPSVIDQTLYNEKAEDVSVNEEVEISSVLSYFEVRRDPDGKIKKKSKEDFQFLMKVYWPYYLIPLEEEDSAIGFNGMGLESIDIFNNLEITNDQIDSELIDFETEQFLIGLQKIEDIFQRSEKNESISGLLNSEFTKALIDISYISGDESELGIIITPVIDSLKIEKLIKKFRQYPEIIKNLEDDLNKKKEKIEDLVSKKIDLETEKIENIKRSYTENIESIKPSVEKNKKKVNENREIEIKHLKEARQNEIFQTMNLIKESFKPIEDN